MDFRRHTKTAGLVLTLSLGMAALLFALPFYLFSDQMLAARLTSGIQKGIAHTGLKLEIGSVHWVDLNHLTARRVVFKDSLTGDQPLRVEQINFRFNIFALLKNHRYPEAGLRQVELVRPVVKVYRINDDDWNWEYYFRNHRRELRFHTFFTVKQGQIELQDQRYGRRLAQNINGRFNLKKYPLVKWDLNGGMVGQADLNWSSRGQTKIRHHYGNGELLLKQAPLVDLAVFLPYPEHYQLRSGLVDLQLHFGWDQKGFQIRQGRLKLTEAQFTWEQSKQLFQLRLAEAEFTPEQVKVNQAQLTEGQSRIKLAGSYNRQTGAIHGSINADPVDLTALARSLPSLQQHAPGGIGRAYLTVGGTWQKPIINGTLLVEKGQLNLAGREAITGINGRITINHNQLRIPKLEAVWRQLRLDLSGQITNLWQPELKLQLTGTGLNLDQFGQNYPKLTRLNRLHTGTASFTATISGPLQRPVLNGELKIDRIAYNDHTITNFRTSFGWDHPDRCLVLHECYGDLWGGQLGGTGVIRFQADQVSWLLKGELFNFNLSEVSTEQLRDLKGRGSATLMLQGAWRQGEPFNPGLVQGKLRSRDLSYHDLYLESVAADFNWHDQNLTVSAINATAADGAFNGRLTWEEQQLLLELTTAGIKLRPFLPDAQKYPLDGIFAGSLVLWGPLTRLEGRLEGIFTTATWGAKPIGTIKGTLSYQNHRIGATDLRIDSETGIFMINGGIDWEHWGVEPILDLELRSDNLNLNGLQRWLPWNQVLPIDGTGQIRLLVTGLASNPRFDGELGLNRPSWGNLVFERGLLKFTSNQQSLTLAELKLTNTNAFIKASGMIDQEGHCDLIFNGEGIDLSAFQINYLGKPLRGRLLTVGRIGGSLNDPVISAGLTSSDLVWGDLQKVRLTAELQGDRRRIEINSAELSSGEGSLRIQGQILLSQPTQLELELFLTNLKLPDLLALIGTPTMDVTGQVSGKVKLTGTTTNPIWGVRGSLDQGSFNAIPISGEFDLNYQRDQLTLQRVYLKHREGSLLANGSWEKKQSLQLRIQLVDFPIQALQPWWPAGKDWAGLINATINSYWAPQRVDGKIVAGLNQLSYKKQAIGDLRLKGDFSGQGLAIEEAWLDSQNGHLSAKGYLSWPQGLRSDLGRLVTGGLGNRKLDLRVSLKNVPAELANLFSPKYLVTRGKLDGRLQLKGTWEQPELSGKLDGDNLKLSLPVLPLPIEDLEFALTIETNRATLRRAVGNYGSGRFELNGSTVLDGFKPASFGLNLTGKKIYYRNHYLDGYGDMNLRLAGGPDDAILSGAIVLHHCKLGILGPRPPRRKYQFRPRLELMVHTAQNVHYRQPGFADVTVKGSLQVTGVWGAMVLNGEVMAKRGIVTLYGQTFKVDRGKAVFKNSRGFKPYLDLEARFTHAQADVFLIIRGQVGTDLSLNLSSQPYLPQQSLLSLINWEEQRDGRPVSANNTAPLGNGDLSLIADSVLSEIFYNLRSAIQVDYLYLEHDYHQDELRINIGQYLTDKLFLAYSRSVSNTTTPNQQWSFDYSLTPKLKAGGTFSETEGTFWRLLYRIHF